MTTKRSHARPTTIRVGYESHNYGGERNTYAPVDGVHHTKVRRIPFEYTPGDEHRGLHRVFAPLGPSRNIDLLHLWNRVSIGRVPWGVSFEETLPYLNARKHPGAIQHQKKRLLSTRCRFIIGMSDYALNRLRDSSTEEELSHLSSKMHRVYPHHAEPLRTGTYPNLVGGGPMRLVFVGGDFFRKGGEAILRAIETAGDHLELELTVISRVEGNDYRGTPPDDVDVDDVRSRLHESPRIEWKQSLPHHEVMRLIQGHHIGLLPSFSDTFGYSVLEFMSLGVPSIVSNVQALPEFTGPDTGWVIDVPTDSRGIWLGRDPDLAIRRSQYHDSVGHVASRLVEILEAVRSNPNILLERSGSALDRFVTQFDPVERRETMVRIYREALG